MEKMVEGAATDARATRGTADEAGRLLQEVGERLAKQIAAKGRSLQKIPIQLIRLDENVRQNYDAKALDALGASLAADGLIQYPTVCLRENNGVYELICRNGHRRILAAQRLGWSHIDCVINSFDSEKDELYHSLNANMREDVFYLDIAHAYAEAASLGESDQEIAARVSVNPRTVGQYRRLAQMSQQCEKLARAYPRLFNATWAVKMARAGSLPPPDEFYDLMQEMVACGKSWIPKKNTEEGSKKQGKPETRSRAAGKKALTAFLSEGDVQTKHAWATEFLRLLQKSGYLQTRTVKGISKEVLESAKSPDTSEVAD
jgi:ParB/RepB/Spo0J family partition protein